MTRRLLSCVVWAAGSAVAVLVWSALILTALALVGCADQPAPQRPPAAEQAETYRTREAAHRQAAAAATDITTAAMHQRLAAELAALATAAEARTGQQQAEMDRRSAVAAAEAEAMHWRTITRWLGLGGIVAAGLVGGALSWLVGPRLGIPVALIFAGTGLLTAGYGQSVRWVPLTLLLAALIAGGAWIWAHRRDLRLAKDRDAAGRAAADELHEYADHLGFLDPVVRGVLDRDSIKRQGTHEPTITAWLASRGRERAS